MRQPYGAETWKRLLDWDKGQTPSERLGALMLYCDGFNGIDPSHPLGGKDGLKDLTFTSDGKKFIAACYFCRGQKEMKEIKDKFLHDIKGVKKNNANGFIFITNQELRLKERQELIDCADKDIQVEIYHLERIAQRLETPTCYGLRLEYLQIPMTQEEQIAFFSNRDQTIASLINKIDLLSDKLNNFGTNEPEEKKEFPEKVNPITFYNGYSIASGNIGGYHSPFHRCTKCKYGMLINSTGYGYTTGSPFPAQRFIQCTSCGNVDELNRPFL